MNSDLVVVTPADVTALTTLERVKQELSINDSANDDLLSAKIEEASSDIAVRCGPTLRRETVTETFYSDLGGDYAGRFFAYLGLETAEKLILRRYPVAAVGSVTVDGVVLTEAVIVDDVVTQLAEYRVRGEAGLLYRQSIIGNRCPWAFSQNVAVTYDGGYLLPGQAGRDLPPSLEAACVELVSSYWASRGRDPTLKSETNEGVASFTYWVGAIGEAGDLPPGVMAKISPYLRRWSFA